jgi:hypothetical protein
VRPPLAERESDRACWFGLQVFSTLKHTCACKGSCWCSTTCEAASYCPTFTMTGYGGSMGKRRLASVPTFTA